MADKCKCPPEGAPLWMTTFADMMTLLLCFFVLIVSFSEIKKEDKYQAVVEEIQKAFGMHGGGGRLPIDDDPALSLLQILETTRLRQEKVDERSRSEDPGIDGDARQVKQVREGMLFVTGGPVTFEDGSADLTPSAQGQLLDLVPEIKGIKNMVQVRGHTGPLEEATDEARHDLAYRRARTVYEFLASDQVGIDVRRMRLVSVGSAEPLENRDFGAAAQQPNRRVEIILTEALVKDFTAPQ